MITTIFLYFIYGFVWLLTLPLQALDNAVLPSFVTDNTNSVISLLGNINNFFNLSLFFSCLATVLIFEFSILTIKLFFWIRKLI